MQFEDTYEVIARKVTTSWFGTRTFYVPRKRYQYGGSAFGTMQPFMDSEEYPSVWGYDTEADAWAVCEKDWNNTPHNHSEYTGPTRGDREDFHADG